MFSYQSAINTETKSSIIKYLPSTAYLTEQQLCQPIQQDVASLSNNEQDSQGHAGRSGAARSHIGVTHAPAAYETGLVAAGRSGFGRRPLSQCTHRRHPRRKEATSLLKAADSLPRMSSPAVVTSGELQINHHTRIIMPKHRLPSICALACLLPKDPDLQFIRAEHAGIQRHGYSPWV